MQSDNVLVGQCSNRQGMLLLLPVADLCRISEWIAVIFGRLAPGSLSGGKCFDLLGLCLAFLSLTNCEGRLHSWPAVVATLLDGTCVLSC